MTLWNLTTQGFRAETNLLCHRKYTSARPWQGGEKRPQTLQETLEANFSLRGLIILNMETHSSVPGQQCSEHISLLPTCRYCQQGASKGNNRIWFITALLQFYLAINCLGLGIFSYCNNGCIAPSQANFIHAAHALPWSALVILRKGNVFLLLFVLQFFSIIWIFNQHNATSDLASAAHYGPLDPLLAISDAPIPF